MMLIALTLSSGLIYGILRTSLVTVRFRRALDNSYPGKVEGEGPPFILAVANFHYAIRYVHEVSEVVSVSAKEEEYQCGEQQKTNEPSTRAVLPKKIKTLERIAAVFRVLLSGLPGSTRHVLSDERFALFLLEQRTPENRSNIYKTSFIVARQVQTVEYLHS
ncbi:hypothetical protein RB195_004922 [Necator americanus]|uniref:Uncharacterized protein n=1 Tax=Necator americanus TaxID=51031 RepID=A0ABR1BPL3_NECAM